MSQAVEGMRRSETPATPKGRKAAVALVFTGIVLSAGFGLWAIVGAVRDVDSRQRVKAGEARMRRPIEIEIPTGLPAPDAPPQGPIMAGQVRIGTLLFFDPRLSADNSVSCASCHDPERGWSDDSAVATGIRGQRGGRNTPTVVNAVHLARMFWDGRAADLEEQALGPILNPIEMGMPSEDALVEKVYAIEGYRAMFEATYDDGVTAENIARCLAAFERTLLAGDTPMDRFLAGDRAALSDRARRGKELFFGKANCSVCHSGENYTDDEYHNLGSGFSKNGFDDIGREQVTGNRDDRHAFRTPPLRDIARTPPYMHNGRYETLEEVVDFYDRGGIHNRWLDPAMEPLGLTPREKSDLVAFMREGLTSRTYPVVRTPRLPR